jgi:hypothetical protein
VIGDREIVTARYFVDPLARRSYNAALIEESRRQLIASAMGLRFERRTAFRRAFAIL